MYCKYFRDRFVTAKYFHLIGSDQVKVLCCYKPVIFVIFAIQINVIKYIFDMCQIAFSLIEDLSYELNISFVSVIIMATNSVCTSSHEITEKFFQKYLYVENRFVFRFTSRQLYWSELRACTALWHCRQHVVSTINGIFLLLPPQYVLFGWTNGGFVIWFCNFA